MATADISTMPASRTAKTCLPQCIMAGTRSSRSAEHENAAANAIPCGRRMTTDAELFDALKYRVDISPLTGTRRYYNTAQLLHREDGPAIDWPNGSKEWYQNGVWLS